MKAVPEELLLPDTDDEAICTWLYKNRLAADYGPHGVMIGSMGNGSITDPLAYMSFGRTLKEALQDYAHRQG